MIKSNDVTIRIDILDDTGKTLKSLLLPAHESVIGGMGNVDIYEIIARVLVNSGVNFTSVISN